MMDAFNRVLEAATFDIVAKFLILVLLVAAVAALWELFRHIRALRKERDLARHLAYRQMYEEARRARRDPVERAPRRQDADRGAYRTQSLFSGLLRGTVQAVGVLFILILVAGTAASPFLGTWLEQQDYPEKAEYIVALPGDAHRLLKAAELYNQGFAPKILLGVEPQGSVERLRKLRLEAGYPNIDSDEFQLRVLEKMGVPRASTASLGADLGTIAETAEALKKQVEDRRLKIIVVTAAPQSLRTKVVFQDIMPRARFVVVSPAGGGNEPPVTSDQDALLATLAEAARLMHYWVGSRLRMLRTEPGTPPQDTRASQSRVPGKPVESLGAGPGSLR